MVSKETILNYFKKIREKSKELDIKALTLENEKRNLLKEVIKKHFLTGYKPESAEIINRVIIAQRSFIQNIRLFLQKQQMFLQEYNEWYRKRANAFIKIDFEKRLETNLNFCEDLKKLILEHHQHINKITELVSQQASLIANTSESDLEKIKQILLLCINEFEESDVNLKNITKLSSRIERSLTDFFEKEIEACKQVIDMEKTALFALQNNPKSTADYFSGYGKKIIQRISNYFLAANIATMGVSLAWMHFSPFIQSFLDAAMSGNTVQAILIGVIKGTVLQFVLDEGGEDAVNRVQKLTGGAQGFMGPEGM